MRSRGSSRQWKWARRWGRSGPLYLIILILARPVGGEGNRPQGAGIRFDLAITDTGCELFELVPEREEEAQSVYQDSRFPLGTLPLLSEHVPMGTPALKIAVREEGIYRISGRTIFSVDPGWRGARVAHLRLMCQGKPVPIWVEDEDRDGLLDDGDAIEFWGEPYKLPPHPAVDDRYYDAYTRTNIYWLTRSASAPEAWLVPLDVGVTSADLPEVTWGPARIHLEEDQIFDRLGRIPYPVERDHWFWGTVGGRRLELFAFRLPVPDTGRFAQMGLKVCLSGRTYGEQGRHRVQVLLNGRQIGDPIEWRDQDYVIASFAEVDGLSPALLHPGVNVLGILNLSANEAEEVLFNWAELDFPQRYEIVDGYLKFSGPPLSSTGRLRFRVTGFCKPEVEIFKLGVGKLRGFQLRRSPKDPLRWEVAFEDESVGPADVYVALEPERKRDPVRIWPAKVSFWASDWLPGFDYLIVGPDSFLQAPVLDKLVALRERRGLGVARVPVEQIYDEFACGLCTPEAIRRFLLQALQKWPRRPRYLLLLGASALVRDVFDHPSCLVPSLWVQTVKYGSAPCDNQFSVRSPSEPLPEVATGRLPVRNLEELRIVVEKICAYEEAPPGEWLDRVLAIAGVGSAFRQQLTELLGQQFDRAHLLRRMDAGPPPSEYTGGTGELVEAWNQGLGMVHFLGHGGGRIWSDNSLLTYDGVQKLKNGNRLPVVASWTCFTGAFDGHGSLGTRLLLHEGGGAVAVLGATGVGWVWNDYYLLCELLRVLGDEGISTIGEAVRLAKCRYYSRYPTALAKSQLNQYTLLGDPATPIRLARRMLELEARWMDQDAEVVAIGPIPNGVVPLHLEAFHPSQPARATEMPFQWQGDSAIVSLRGSTIRPDSFMVRGTFWDGGAGVLCHTVLRPTCGTARIDSLWWEPGRPRVGEGVRVGVRAHIPRGSRLFLSSPGLRSTTELRAAGENLYWTAEPIVFLRPGVVGVDLWVQGSDGSISASRSFRLDVLPEAGYAVDWQSVGLEVQGSRLYVVLTVTSEADNAGRACVIHFYSGPTDAGPWRWMGGDTVKMESASRQRVRFPWPEATAPAWLRLEYRDLEGGQVRALLKRLEAPVLWAAPSGKIRSRAGTADSAAIGPFVLRLYACPRDTVAIIYDLLPLDSLRCVQPHFRPQAIGGVGGLCLRCEADEETALAITLSPDVPSAEEVRLCFLDRRGLWLVLDDGRSAAVVLSGKGEARLGLFRVEDRVPPALLFLCGGREFAPGDFVAPDELCLRSLDANGLDIRPGSLQLFLDGRPLQSGPLLELTTPSPTEAVWRLRLPFASGEHRIEARARDCAGNWASASTRISIAAAGKLMFLGNYPNPFRGETILAYELTARAERLGIDVFAPSGLRVRTLVRPEDPDPLAPGYHEVSWDGRDDRGEPVAPGVYFVRLWARIEGKEQQHVAKVARVP
ncbi:MAG: C25 family cysteine peptidase [candidate division KSB1 bacterium]|nr:C25 family cysteine peptidase [candidate division KSB1 bacterium]